MDSGPANNIRLAVPEGNCQPDFHRSKLPARLERACFPLPRTQKRRASYLSFDVYPPRMLIVITSGFQKGMKQTPPAEITGAEQLRKPCMNHRNHYTGSQKESNPEGVGPTRRIAKHDRHSEVVEQQAKKSLTYRRTFPHTLHQIGLALLIREMREGASLTKVELAKKAGTAQSVVARLEDAGYRGTRSRRSSASPRPAVRP
jgi:ribosome-binding protein aMBF1 (putative translation factor)